VTARLIVLRQLSRPAVLMLLALYSAIGLAQAGRENDLLLFVQLLPVIAGFLIFSVVVNDVADEAIDRINLPGGHDRPLVAGTSSKRGLATTGLVAGVIALVTSVTVGWLVTVVFIAGMAISAGYSMRPVRLAERGAVASLVLPAGLVAVPYLGGVLAASDRVTSGDVALLSGLYVAFIGRILLKDFRDVRGDALLGKRTFLVRHGRVWTCAVSATCWVLGTAIVVAALDEPQPTLVAIYSGAILAVLVLLWGIATATTPKREESLIAATVIIGRGMAILLLAHLSMTGAEWSTLYRAAVLMAIAILAAGHARTVLHEGTVSSLVVPDDLTTAADPDGLPSMHK
jgi:4-hydroxybenzoate polyprenyltransferase